MEKYTISNVIDSFEDLEFNSYNSLRNKYFDELSSCNNSSCLIKLLEIYSFGNIDDYLRFKDDLIELSDGQLLKLRQLTLMSLLRTSNVVPLVLIKDKLKIEEDVDLLNVLMKLSSFSSLLMSYYIDCERSELIVRFVKSRDVYKNSDIERPLLLLDESKIDKFVKLDYLIDRLQEFKDVKINNALEKVKCLQ